MCRLSFSHHIFKTFLLIISTWEAAAQVTDSTSKDVAKFSNRTGRILDVSLDHRQPDDNDEIPDFSNADSNPTKSENVPTANSKYRPLHTGSFDEQQAPRSLPSYYSNFNGARRFGYYPNQLISASSSNTHWNAWKDDADDSKDTKTTKGSPPEFYHIHKLDQPWMSDPWNANPWNGDLAAMVDTFGANGLSDKSSFLESLFNKFTSDPMALLVAGLLPLTLILAAVLPTIVNMMMTGQGIPTFTTTATGNKSLRYDSGAEFLNPVLEAIMEFGMGSLDDPSCMQRIFCQVTKGGDESGSSVVQKTLYAASALVDDSLLENMGLKMLFDSLENGDCEKIPCSTKEVKQSGIKNS